MGWFLASNNEHDFKNDENKELNSSKQSKQHAIATKKQTKILNKQKHDQIPGSGAKNLMVTMPDYENETRNSTRTQFNQTIKETRNSNKETNKDSKQRKTRTNPRQRRQKLDVDHAGL